jgi:hypothetical protein
MRGRQPIKLVRKDAARLFHMLAHFFSDAPDQIRINCDTTAIIPDYHDNAFFARALSRVHHSR